tara:strand:+ start:5060 stop:5722 length:663 start_codon:yes stop_codon:yes gene_type:complete
MDKRKNGEMLGLIVTVPNGNWRGLKTYYVKAGYKKSAKRGQQKSSDREIFISNPSLRSALEVIGEHVSFERPLNIGEVGIIRYAKEKLIKVDLMYPLGWANEPAKKPTPESIRMPTGLPEKVISALDSIGLATLIQLQIEKNLLGKFGNKYMITAPAGTTDEGKKYLLRKGRKLGEAIPLTEAIALSKAEVIRQYKKHNRLPTKRPKRPAISRPKKRTMR